MQEKLYLNMTLIKSLMKERGLTEKTLSKKMEIPIRRLHFYLNTWKQKRVSLKIAILFILTLEIPFKEIVTTIPPHKTTE